MLKLKTTFAMLLAAAAMCAANDKDWAQIQRYDAANKELLANGKSLHRVVFLGNSITDFWPSAHPAFFDDNNFVGRGISGQTSYQFLTRFREDVVNLKPEAVVINTATNDIAENTGPYHEDRTFGNILSMIEIAQANGIKVILSTVLPAKAFGWNPSVTDAPEKISRLNKRIAEYAAQHNIPMIDYFTPLADADGVSLNPAYSADGVHPNEKGYEVMEKAALPVIRETLKQNR